ncbi:MAG: hypothetical protein JJT93_03305 [Gammaproteobacteria bacterium]|nr:hypothetical protein [Gammaproteobacteria bacterium]
MDALIANLWIIALAGLIVTGLALQRRFASLRALIADHHPELARELGGSPDGPPPVPAVLQWLIAGHWMRVEDPLLKAYGATCLRLLRLCLAWLVGLLAAALLTSSGV